MLKSYICTTPQRSRASNKILQQNPTSLREKNLQETSSIPLQSPQCFLVADTFCPREATTNLICSDYELLTRCMNVKDEEERELPLHPISFQ